MKTILAFALLVILGVVLVAAEDSQNGQGQMNSGAQGQRRDGRSLGILGLGPTLGIDTGYGGYGGGYGGYGGAYGGYGGYGGGFGSYPYGGYGGYPYGHYWG